MLFKSLQWHLMSLWRTLTMLTRNRLRCLDIYRLYCVLMRAPETPTSQLKYFILGTTNRAGKSASWLGIGLENNPLTHLVNKSLGEYVREKVKFYTSQNNYIFVTNQSRLFVWLSRIRSVCFLEAASHISARRQTDSLFIVLNILLQSWTSRLNLQAGQWLLFVSRKHVDVWQIAKLPRR